MICLTLSSPTIEGCLGEIERNREYIDMVELRADLLDESELENAKEFPSRSSFPAILTIRRTVDGGRYEKSEKDRRELFLSLLDGGFSYVDIIPVTTTFTLPDQASIQALFGMTPYAWKTPKAGVERLKELEQLTVTADFRVHVFRREGCTKPSFVL